MRFWLITILLTIPITAVSGWKRLWRLQPPTQTLTDRAFRWLAIVGTSFLFSTTLTCWYYSARFWRAERERVEAESKVEKAARDAEMEEFKWTQSHSTPPSTYPPDATPTDALSTSGYQSRVFGTRQAPRQQIDFEYEQTLQPGYAPKF